MFIRRSHGFRAKMAAQSSCSNSQHTHPATNLLSLGTFDGDIRERQHAVTSAFTHNHPLQKTHGTDVHGTDRFPENLCVSHVCPLIVHLTAVLWTCSQMPVNAPQKPQNASQTSSLDRNGHSCCPTWDPEGSPSARWVHTPGLEPPSMTHPCLWPHITYWGCVFVPSRPVGHPNVFHLCLEPESCRSDLPYSSSPTHQEDVIILAL